MLIPEEVCLEEIRTAEERYLARYGGKPFDLSHWNAGPQFAEAVRPYLAADGDGNIFDYIYSSEMPELGAIAQKLSVHSDECRISLAPTGTSAQMLVSFVLRAIGVRRVHLVSPHYFAARYALEGAGLEVKRLPLARRGDRLVLEALPTIQTPDAEAIWWTDPVFTFGTDCDDASCAALCRAAAAGTWIVSDQSLARPGMGLHQHAVPRNRIMSIHCPHKAICVNGLKFGAVAFPADLEDAFWQWADVVFGGLSMSNVTAARHFVSPAFDEALIAAEAQASATRLFCASVAQSQESARWSGATAGLFASLFLERLPATFADRAEALESVMNASGASFITGTRNGVPPSIGFSFRVNVARDGPQFRGALVRLVRHLESLVP